MLSRVHLPLAFVALASCACVPAQAPKPNRPPAKPNVVSLPSIVPNVKWTLCQNAAQLLLRPDVQNDLGLASGTRNGVLKVYAAYEAKYTSLTAGKTAGTDQLAAELDKAVTDAANQAISLLSDSENARLSQLGVQTMGLDALRMPEVRNRLHLTADQTAQLDQLFVNIDAKQSALDGALGERLSKVPDPGPKATDDETAAFKKATQAVLDELAPQGHAVEALKKAGWDAFMAALTPDQKAAWQAIHGKPIVD
ncbi:MAG: Spy/CpxP family protein refolding chaperone [Fimbriimonadaceae bacterium]